MGFGSLVREVVGRRGLKHLVKDRFVESRVRPYLSADTFVRASSFASLCPREEVICSRKRINRDRTVAADLNLIFAHGSGLHYALQNIVLPPTGALLGAWRCVRCGVVVGGAQPGVSVVDVAVCRPEGCENCGSKPDRDGHSPFVYEECSFLDDNYRLTGHCDGLLVLPGVPGIGIFEAKSVNSRSAWKIRSVPNMDHVVQVHIYMMLTGAKWAVLLYWDKSGAGVTALVEHFVERDEETIFSIQDTLKGLWAAVLDEGLPLPTRICADASCPRARECCVVEPCFASDS